MKINNLRLATLLLIFLPSALFISCKKGENDPAISFRSRKARIVGDWKLEKGTSKSTSGNSVMITTFNGNSGTEIDESDTLNFTYVYELSFKKDGTYSLNFTQTYSGESPDIFKYEGRWSFARKNKSGEIKNREYILLSNTSGSYTSDGITSSGTLTTPTYGELYAIDQLEHDRMVIKSSSNTSNSYNGNTNNGKYESEMSLIPR